MNKKNINKAYSQALQDMKKEGIKNIYNNSILLNTYDNIIYINTCKY